MKVRTLLLLVIALSAALAWAQTSNQGAIAGTITDASGAVIPGAHLTATNRDTGVRSQSVSNQVGEYRFTFLVPGKYQVTAKAGGFQTTQATDLDVTVGQLLRANLQLHVATASEQVTVTDIGTPLNVDSGARSEVIESEAIKNLPLNGREWIQLTTLVPGAESGNVKRGTYTNKGVEVSFNGARDTYNSYYVDGADSTDAYHNTLISSPALDAIKEFRVETNMYSSQYGRSGGAVVLAVTNSGTNTFHGSLYEYHRNKALDTRPPFATKPKSQLPNYLFNQYGGTVGGPIIKNKAFFFFSMEKFRQVSPGSLMVSFAPTAAEAAGDVSNTINPFSGKPVVLKNPFTGATICDAAVTKPCVLPSNLISPIGQTLMGIWSQYQPNYNDPYLNLRFFRGGHNRQNKYLPRIDYTISSKDSVFGTFDWDDYDTTNVYHTVYGDKDYQEHDKTADITYTHMFTPNLVNDLKWSRTWDTQGSQFVLNDQSYGVKWGMYGPLNAGKGSPRILMYTQGYATFGIGGDGPLYHNQRTLYFRDNLAWIKGKHSVHFGGDFRRQNFLWSYDSGQTQDYFGLLDGLPGYETIYGETGSTFTDLLTAAPNLMSIGTGGGNLMRFSRNAFAGYVQDDWKVTSRLTLNLGVRYDYEAPFSIDNGEFLSLDFNTGLPIYCKDAPQNLLAIMHYNFETGGPCRDHKPDYHNVSPRVGFAWQPFKDTVVRAGYGLFYTSENAYNTTYGGWVQPFGGLFSWNPGSYFWRQPSNQPVNPLLDGQAHFTTLDQKPYGLEFAQGKSMGFFYPTVPYYPTAYTEQYNLTLGRELKGRTTVELGYVGSHGINLNGPSTIYNYDPTLLTKVQTANPQLSNFGLRTKGFSSYFNSLQASAKKQMTHGVYFIAAYTWSHALTDMSNDDTNETLLTDTSAAGAIITKRIANADFDYRQRFTFSGIWALPFGRGHELGSGWNPVLDAFAGGWQVNAIGTLQGGFPFTVYDTALHFPDRTCSGVLPKSQRTATQWFDYKCFPTHTPTTIIDPVTGVKKTVGINGNSPPNVMRGPGTNNWDLGVEKNFKMGERYNLQFRGEFFNALNHLNLQAPAGNYFFNTKSGAAITRAANSRDIQLALRFSF
jgi:hypothetical protein